MKFAFKNKWLVFVLLIWAVIFSFPSLRVLLKTMAEGSPWIPFTVIPNHYLDARFGPDSPELPLQVESIKGSDIDGYVWPKNFETLNKLDQLISKNPNLPWLIALRLQVTTTIFRKNRIGGELSDGRPLEHLKAGISSPETTGEKVNFTPEQMKQTLALCGQGEKLEPQNAFFSWTRACFLLINWQDQKAWQALDEAAHKTYWNDHAIEFTNIYADAASKVLNRPLLPMESLELSSVNEPTEFGGPKEEICRIINWEGIKHKREGKNLQALQIWSNFHHTMFLATQGDADLSDFEIDTAMLSIAQSGATYPNRNDLKKTIEKEQKENGWPLYDQKKIEKERKNRVNGFIAYAEKYHRLDLARQIKKDAEQGHQLLQKKCRNIEMMTAFLHITLILNIPTRKSAKAYSSGV